MRPGSVCFALRCYWSRVRGACRAGLHGSLVAVKTFTSSRLNVHCAQMILLQGLVRRQQQLSRRRWLHDVTASYVRSRSRHIFSASLGTPRADGARQVRLACAKPQTSREVDQDLEGGLIRHCKTRPSFLVMCCLWETPSQVDVTFHNDYDEPELPEHEVQVPEDAHEEGKPCLIWQDTICSGHISRCLFLSHTPCQFLR